MKQLALEGVHEQVELLVDTHCPEGRLQEVALLGVVDTLAK